MFGLIQIQRIPYMTKKMDWTGKRSDKKTDRFVQKGGKRVTGDRFGLNAGGKNKEAQDIIKDLELRAFSAENKLKRSEKLNSSIKTAIRRIVRTERDIKTSLAILTDANSSLPTVRKTREEGLG